MKMNNLGYKYKIVNVDGKRLVLYERVNHFGENTFAIGQIGATSPEDCAQIVNETHDDSHNVPVATFMGSNGRVCKLMWWGYGNIWSGPYWLSLEYDDYLEGVAGIRRNDHTGIELDGGELDIPPFGQTSKNFRDNNDRLPFEGETWDFHEDSRYDYEWVEERWKQPAKDESEPILKV